MPFFGRGGRKRPPPTGVGLTKQQKHCEKPKKIFAFQIGHFEIGKVTKFEGVLRLFWGF